MPLCTHARTHMECVAGRLGLREALELLVEALSRVREDHLVVVLVHHRLG
jgi:hypothetical protein